MQPTASSTRPGCVRRFGAVDANGQATSATAVAAIYGMNFERMAELKWAYGYHVVFGGIMTLCALLYIRFRRVGRL